MEWEKFSLENKELFNKYLNNYMGISDFTFTNFFIWSVNREISFYEEDESLGILIKYKNDDPFIFMPIGKNWKNLIFKIKDYFIKQNIKFQLKSVTEEMLELLKKEIGEKNLNIIEERDRFDYIYSVQELIELSGKKFHKKKNLINNFIKNNKFEYIKLDKNNINEILKLQNEWCDKNSCSKDVWLDGEDMGIKNIVKNFEKLSVVAAAIYVDNRVVAFSIGEQVSSDCVVIHIEKGDSNYQGSYQIMNQMFLKNEFSHLTYVNREEDLGIEGLRQAKLSYNPLKLIKKYRVEFK